MRFDEPSQSFVIDDDFALPAKFYICEDEDFPMPTRPGGILEHRVRVMRCTFENRWSLSIIWGSLTYSSNHGHPWGLRTWVDVPPDGFTEEPSLVEVGIIMPEQSTRPAQHFDLGRGPVDIPEMPYELWGDPLGYVDAPGLRFLVGIVSRFDSHIWVEPEDGPYLERDGDGRYHLNFTPRKEQPCDDSTPDGSQQ